MQPIATDELPLDDTPVHPWPRRLPAWLPFLWSQALFPGKAPAWDALRPWALAFLLVVPAVLLYGCLSFHLFEPDEGRYAEIPREMLLRGEWIVPYLQGEPYLDKPPLLYWLVMLSYRAFGPHNWSARLVPAVAIHLCVLLTYLLGRRSLGERPAFWGALLLALAPGFVSIGRLLVLDGLLTLWVSLSLFATFEAVRGTYLRRGWWLLAALACGLGVLTKGPVAVLLLVPPLWAYRRLTGKSCTISWAAILVFVAVALAVALPWYVAICCRLPSFARHFLWQHNVVRFVAPFDHLRPVWFYGPVLLAGLVPGTLLIVPFVRFLCSAEPTTAARRCPALGFTLLAGGWCVLFFSLAGSKLPTYVMPAFPPLCLALGYFLAGSRWQDSRWPRWVGGVAFALMCAGHNLVLPWYSDYRAPLGRLTELKDYCENRDLPIICYPRNCDSVAFYVGRDDLRSYRSKETHVLVHFLQTHPRAVLLFTHRNSLESLRHALTPDLQLVNVRHLGLAGLPWLPEGLRQKATWLMGETSLGLCDIAVVEHRPESKKVAEFARIQAGSKPEFWRIQLP
jgi:4-amino-4-deoxy-L-arabinose transferase-like glycosyltransferase